MLDVPLVVWVGFSAFVLGVLALDLGVFHRRSHVVSTREALGWTSVWVTLAMAFGAGLWRLAGPERALEYLTGYVIELSLSADNVFVIAMLFGAFAVPERQQHRVLFWGVLGAGVMRLLMVLGGAALVQQAAWVLYGFGALLVVAGVKMIVSRGEAVAPERNPLVRAFRRFVPVTDGYRGGRFVVREAGRRMATPLLVVLVCIEATDLVFAIDSIPAVFSVTTDPFLVFTSNAFAILGLRSLYFLLARALHAFRWLKPALGLVLAFAGAKLLLAHTAWKIDDVVALLVVLGTLTAGVVASLLHRAPRVTPAPAPAADDAAASS